MQTESPEEIQLITDQCRLHVKCASVKGGPSQLMGRVCGDAQVLMRRVLERPITIRLVNSVIIEG